MDREGKHHSSRPKTYLYISKTTDYVRSNIKKSRLNKSFWLSIISAGIGKWKVKISVAHKNRLTITNDKLNRDEYV